MCFVSCDQCADGHQHKRSTRRFTNTQAFAKQLARKSRCKVTHDERAMRVTQLVLGSWRCAICMKAAQHMKIDFAAAMRIDQAFPAEDRKRSRRPGREKLMRTSPCTMKINQPLQMCLELFNELEHAMGESLAALMWRAELLARRTAEAWCAEETWVCLKFSICFKQFSFERCIARACYR